MTKIFVITHGDLAKGLISSAEMLIGKQENTISFGLQPGMSSEDFLMDISSAVAECSKDEEVLIFCDILGGTPCNVSRALFMTNSKISMFYGVNLPILVEAMMQQKFMSNNDLIQHLKTMLRKTQGFFIQGEEA